MRKYRNLSLVLIAGMTFMLTGCKEWEVGTTTPDYRILVAPKASGHGYVAIPPECAEWRDAQAGPFDNQPIPHHGCAQARNLALMIDNPQDLVAGRPTAGEARRATAAIERYEQDKVRGLYDPKTPPSAKE